MVESLLEEDTSKVGLIGELLKDRCRGATHRVAEIDGIAEVDGKGQHVDNDKQAAAEAMIHFGLLKMEREKDHHYP